MDTLIMLGIEKMEIDWKKNFYLTNHSNLFLPEDKKEIPYYYIDEDEDDFDKLKFKLDMKPGYSRKLGSIKNRLDLLGYSIKSIEKKYNQHLEEGEIHSVDVRIPFKSFYEVVYNLDIKKVNTIQWENPSNGFDFGEYTAKCLLQEAEIKKIADLSGEKENFHLGAYFENIDSYIIIRILAENPINNDLELEWRFLENVEIDLISEENIFEEIPNENKILIVTEGSSDSFIINRSIDELYPSIADFFKFIDMKKNYPFTGVGNLFNFLKGLTRIQVQNNIIIIFDNDIAGSETYASSLEIEKLNNIMVCKLPDCHEFENFKTIGPSGESSENINGKAVAIECFLDFDSVHSEPLIRWKSYSKKSDAYQGELEHKDSYVKAFKKANLLDSCYNTKKIRKLIDYLITSWINN